MNVRYPGQICSLDGCEKPLLNKKMGVCQMHYTRMRRTGSFEPTHPHPTDSCVQCGVEFTEAEKHPLKRYCSGRCATRGTRGVSEWVLECRLCGATRDSPRSDAQYCSSRCSTRSYQIKKAYGLEPEEYRSLRDRCDDACEACGSNEKLSVDHCHETGAVRGMLCSGCNVAIGYFREDLEAMRGAIAYLERFSRPAAR